MDWILSIDGRTRDDVITPWMHTYSRLENKWIDTRDTQKDSRRTKRSVIWFLSGKLFHVQTMQSINMYRTFNIDYYYYDCILFTQIVNQGIPRHINTRQCLDNWNYSGAIYSRILFNFLSRRTCTIGQVHSKW